MCFLAYVAPTKICIHCELPWPWELFSLDKRRPDGMKSFCKSCESDKNKASYQRNQPKRVADARQRRITDAERITERRRASYAEDPERFRAQKRAEFARNPQKIRQRNKVQWDKHADVILPHKRDYYANNKHLWQDRAKANPDAIRLVSSRRRARKRALPDTFTEADLAFMMDYWQHTCAICGNQEGLWWTLAADHVIPITSPDCPGTVPENLIPLCHGQGGCNNSKHDKDMETWLLSRFTPAQTKRILHKIETYFAIVRTRMAQQEGAAD